jgi:hypothetical protein
VRRSRKHRRSSGSGDRADFCAAARLVDNGPSVDFAAEAIEAGFAVFALDSTGDAVTDEQGHRCGSLVRS